MGSRGGGVANLDTASMHKPVMVGGRRGLQILYLEGDLMALPASGEERVSCEGLFSAEGSQARRLLGKEAARCRRLSAVIV